MKHFFTFVFIVPFLSHIVFADVSKEIEAIKAFPKAETMSEIVLKTGFDTPEDTAKKLPSGFKVVPGEGCDGTAALFYERIDPNAYPIYGIRMNNLEPGKHYLATLRVRAEGIKVHDSEKNIGVLCVEHYKQGKWSGGFYFSTIKIGTDWERISLIFQAPSEGHSSLNFYLRKRITGKIWFDDVEVRREFVPPAVLMTRPDRLSFFGDDGRFSLRTEATAPTEARILATVSNGGRTRELLLKPEGLDYRGDAGKLEPGPVEIRTKLADRAAKKIVAEDTFELTAYPATPPPKNACTIDEFGRAIVDGKPFMPLGVYGFADEKNYKRLADAGFNCLQLYRSLALKGNVDHKDPVKNVLDGMDLIDRHGLKLIFSLKDQFSHKEWPRKKWGSAEGVDAVAELAVRTVKDHPALLAWYISDEELRPQVPSVLGLRRLISRIDPWHPTWTLTCHYDLLPYYGISGDVLGIDPYPISRQPKEQSIKSIKRAVLAAETTGIPCWCVPQIFNWGIYHLKDKPEEFAESHFPTLEEMRAMALYFAMLGVKGFVFYSNFDICQRYDPLLPGSGEREWSKVVEMVKPVKALEPFVLSTKKPLPIVVDSEPAEAVEAGALLDDAGNFRVIVIGTGGKARGTFTLPDELLRLKKEPLKSQFGKTKSLDGGKYEFVVDAVDSDILE